ncbi:MAG TPA: LPS assembly lipoprotein LptE [Terriglobia bacterium]|nr:LPS assembly lipoprotein LptE [Terriglobia bacterium]
MRFRPGILSPIAISAIAASCLMAGCGYHVEGHVSSLPPDVKIVAVPTFINKSQQYRIEQRVSDAVARQLIERTHYKVTSDPDEADAVIQGTVTGVSTGVIAFNINTGAATALQVVVSASVRVVDRHTNKVLFSNPKYLFREEYQVSQSNSQLFEEEGPALERLSHDFAQTLVTDILENF